VKGMLTRTQAELNCQLDMNRTTKGSHIEVHYNKHTVNFLSCWTICRGCSFLSVLVIT